MTATHLLSADEGDSRSSAPGAGRTAPSHARPAGARAEPPGTRPTWVEVELGAIRANVAALKAQSRASVLMAVVKADGYGHGIVPAARAALDGGADWLAVAFVEEGRVLREAGVTAPVLVLTEPPADRAQSLLAAGLTPTAYSPEFTGALATAAERLGLAPVGIHLKLDTGMRRVGVPQADWEDALRRCRDTPELSLEGLWSHFAVADEPDHPFIAHQAAEFARGRELAGSLGLRPRLSHLCNSAGTLALPDHHYDMVRPGLAVYGLEPTPGLAGSTPLRPALSWYSRISLAKHLAAGEAVSYGLRWAPDVASVVGAVPAGYADGVTRALTNVGEVVVGGRRRRMVGTVCMDQFLVELDEAGAANREVGPQAGDEVCLIGAQGQEAVRAEDWAEWLGTINYEVVCTVGARVPRVHLDGGMAGDGAGSETEQAAPPDAAEGGR